MLLEGRSLSGHERNCFFLNTLSSDQSNGRFATISAVSGLDFDDDGQAAARVDLDQDGDIDLILSNRNAPRVRYMRNENANNNGFVQFLLTGNGQDTNRNAVGARITVILESSSEATDDEPVRLIKTVRAGDGFLTQSSLSVHFGLGEDATIRQVRVQWPNRSNDIEVFESLTTNQRYQIVQGTGVAKAIADRPETLAIKASPTKVPLAEIVMRIPLIHQFLVPQLGFVDFQGEYHDMPMPPNELVLINLWSSTCAPCVKELTEFSERHDELKAAGINILALSIDELQSMPNGRQESRKMAERLNFPFQSGMAPAEVIAELKRFHNALIRMNRPLPMPTSFLIDRNGRLNTIYKGVVDVDTLLDDAKPANPGLLERFARSAPFAGTVLQDPLVNASLERNEAASLNLLGKQYIKERKLDKAISVLKDAVKQVPDYSPIHNQLAIVYGIQGKNELAIQHYREAVTISPDKAELRTNLAQILIRVGEYDEAATHLDHAIQNSPDHADAHYNRGLVYSTKRDLENEKLSYENTLKIKPDHAQALFRLGRIFESENNLSQAKSNYSKALNGAPRSAEVLTSLARVYAKEGDSVEAEKLLRQAIEYKPRFADARFQLGQLFLIAGKIPEARQQFLITLQINRNHSGALSALQRMQRSPGSVQ